MLLMQRLESGAPRVHLDIHTDDLDAEVARLQRLGAKRVQKVQTWWVMRDPAGLLFCVLPMSPGSLNDENAQRWEFGDVHSRCDLPNSSQLARRERHGHLPPQPAHRLSTGLMSAPTSRRSEPDLVDHFDRTSFRVCPTPSLAFRVRRGPGPWA
jgi:Glyoxalase-like domain